MADTPQEQPAQQQPDSPAPPRAADTNNPVLEEAKAREAAIIAAAEEKGLAPIINGPEEDPYKGIDPQFIY